MGQPIGSVPGGFTELSAPAGVLSTTRRTGPENPTFIRNSRDR